MDYSKPLNAAHRLGQSDVIILRCHDKVQFDRQMLARLFAGRSLFEAEDMLCRILESMAQWLDILQHGLSSSGQDQGYKAARRIGLLASQIGMTGMAVAAGHVLICLHARDPVALAATLGRLERAFDLAVVEVWNFRAF